MNRHDTVGQDLVNHCVNDIAVVGARPLFFLDYIGAERLDPPVFAQLIKGFAKACKEAGCALIGGETAQMPGMYQRGEYDLAGTIVGVVDRAKALDGSRIKVGDVIIGLESNGLHTNGYSLARKVLFEPWASKLTDKLPGIEKERGRRTAPRAQQLPTAPRQAPAKGWSKASPISPAAASSTISPRPAENRRRRHRHQIVESPGDLPPHPRRRQRSIRPKCIKSSTWASA
jgi:thiamine monophosphate kinase